MQSFAVVKIFQSKKVYDGRVITSTVHFVKMSINRSISPFVTLPLKAVFHRGTSRE